MNLRSFLRCLPALVLTLIIGTASAQKVIPRWIAPNTRPFIRPEPEGSVEVRGVKAHIDIKDQVAVTELEIALENPTSRPREAVLLLPVPAESALRSFGFDGAGVEPTAKLLPRDEARRIYDRIVAQTKDPALLEFAGTALVQSSVFPVPPRGKQHVKLTYEQILTRDGARTDYALPRTEALEYRIPWEIEVNIRSREPISTLNSPSHEMVVEKVSETEQRVRVSSKAAQQPGTFLLSVLGREKNHPATLLAYPDPKIKGGYFLLLMGAPEPRVETATMKREVILAIDRSGSMAGGKLNQVKNAAMQVVDGLADGEAFNVIVYNEAVETFADAPVIKDAESIRRVRDYIRNLRVSGGTNINDALLEALREKPVAGMMPLVLFLTDGIPTVGTTREKSIRELIEKGNPHKRRVFTFGVGVDVNTPLLNAIARESRGSATFVLPKEDVETKVSQVYRRLSGPLLSDPGIRVIDESGRPVTGRVSDLLPSPLSDIFASDQLVLLGQYRDEDPIKFRLTGNDSSGERAFEFSFPLDHASVSNSYVARLWASRKIATLTEAVRDLGADGEGGSAVSMKDPRMKELVDEIVRLSREFGILSEYTAFLAEEGNVLAPMPATRRAAEEALRDRAWSVRSGMGGVNQEKNIAKGKASAVPNKRNTYLDKEMKDVETANVQQVSDRAYYKQGNRWIDAKAVTPGSSNGAALSAEPKRTITIGSPEFAALVNRLAQQNRQSVFAMRGEILIEVDGETILIR